MTIALRPGDLVTFGPPEHPLSGEVSAVSDAAVTVVVADFMGRAVAFSITDPATIRRVLTAVRRSG